MTVYTEVAAELPAVATAAGRQLIDYAWHSVRTGRELLALVYLRRAHAARGDVELFDAVLREQHEKRYRYKYVNELLESEF